MSGNEPNSSGLMDHALQAAVPMWLIELSQKGVEYCQKRAPICSHVVAEKGDVLMYGSKKVGAAAEVFNRLAEGIACLLIITNGPVPFGKLVFFPNGDVKRYESEKEANAVVWPVQKEANSDSAL